MTFDIIFKNKKNQPFGWHLNFHFEYTVPSIDLLSLIEVPSALIGLTAEFGMGSGVTLSPKTLETLYSKCAYN
jgi:hypothetical protein